MSAPSGRRLVAGLVYGAWAMQVDKVRELQASYERWLDGAAADLDGLEAKLGHALTNEQKSYEVLEGGVAVLPIEGVIAPKANLLTQISGGASAQLLQQQISAAARDPAVRSLVLAIDSPGGSVNGSPEVAAAVREFAASKPVVAVSDGQVASAAYWIASAADRILATGPTVVVGSIGVVATHRHEPAQNGRQVTEIAAGKYKRIASGNAPLTSDGKDYLQAQVDHVYSVFVDAVATNRGVSVDTVLQNMADGRIFIGQQAFDAGLIDGFAQLSVVVSRLAEDPQAYAKLRKVAAPTSARSKAQMASEASRHAKATGMSFVDAFHALGFDGQTYEATGRSPGSSSTAAPIAAAPTPAPPPASPAIDSTSMVAQAKAYATKHQVSFVAAVHALGFDNREPDAGDSAMREVRAMQVDAAKAHAHAKGITFVQALKALGYAA